MIIEICLVLIVLLMFAPKATKAVLSTLILLTVMGVVWTSAVSTFNKGTKAQEAQTEPSIDDEIESDKNISGPPQGDPKKYTLPPLDSTRPPLIDKSKKN